MQGLGTTSQSLREQGEVCWSSWSLCRGWSEADAGDESQGHRMGRASHVDIGIRGSNPEEKPSGTMGCGPGWSSLLKAEDTRVCRG